MAAIRKGYSDGPFGQLHWRMMEPDGPPSKPDLYCLHPAPFSGLAFTNIMPYLAKDRRVFAPDYPGYGGSNPFRKKPSIEEYAEAMVAIVRDRSADNKVDLMGFHTGNLVAAEMTLIHPDHINRLVLIDVPAFDAATSARLRNDNAKMFAITPELDCLQLPWQRGITSRIESQSPDRCFEMFTEQLRPGRLMNTAFHAAFSYGVDERLHKVEHPTLVMATQSGLLEATRRAAKLLPTAKLIERLDITRAVLDEAAEKTASEVLLFLDEDIA